MGIVQTSGTQHAAGVERIGGRYGVETRLAQGGMGCVYRVYDETTARRVALKRLLVSSQREQAALLFAREYHTLASLKHPRVIEVYDFGVDALGPYYTMELLEGSDLRELAPLGYRAACQHLRDIASSLALLHARRLLHRDISARNVRVTQDGRCKLIDFGALTSFGVAGELVGTPPNIAPEAVRGDALDQRADLYSLGTLAYGLLSGRQAYPARRLEDLIDVWKTPPVPLSQLVPEIPMALEQLVMSLLSHDPLARPVTAAEVIERLDSITELEAEDGGAIAEGYLVSPALVGRTAELNRLRRNLSQCVEGRGGALLIEGALGIGKTRLLGELALQAHTLGAAVVHVDAEMHERSFGVMEALVARLLEVLPEQASAAARPHARILAQLSPAIRKRLDVAEDMAVPYAPGEWRGRVQSATEALLMSLSKQRPLLIAVDNVQVADPASLALIASLARTAKAKPLLVACSLRTSETIAAPDAMRLLREHVQSLALHPLDAEEVLMLVRSLFGEVPNHGRLAKWIYDSTAGNPRHSVELARHLADSGAARYVNGIWTLTDDLSGIAPPDLSVLAVAALRELSDDARDFASALCVQHRPLPLDVCVSLWEKGADERVFRAFDELISRGVLRSYGEDCGFSQQSVRTRLLAGLPEARRRALHLRLAELLLEKQPHDPRTGLEAGWHLLRAGDETRGADLLARAAGRTHAVGTINDDFHAAVPALEAALSVYRNQKRSPYQIVPLLTSLARAGYYVDRRLATTYGEAALELLPRLTGLTLATRLRPLLGSMLSLLIGVFWAKLTFKFSRAPREYQFRELFVFLFSCVTTLCGVAAICLDPDRATRYASSLKPLLVLGRGKTPAGIYEYCMLLGQIGTDRWESTRAGLLNLYARFTDEKMFRSLPTDARKLYIGGLAYSNGVVEALRDGSAALEWADRLEKLDLKLYEMVAQHVRSLH
ncbi:MAG TPA: protein kinase, partial [Polyangiaceae bacterium]|nr:protein kinase [Polyangiaceae bacterium]